MLFYNEKIFKRCFDHRGKYWYKNIKEIPLYFKLMHHLIKYGYDEYATWGTFSWFTTTMHSILQRYRDNHWSYPAFIDNYPADNSENKELKEITCEMWDDIIDHMIELLDIMDESSSRYDAAEYKGVEGWRKKDEEMTTAKNEFFELFSKHFFNLWD